MNETQVPDVFLDDVDRAVINALQGGFPVTEAPFAEAGQALGLSEDELIGRVSRLVADGLLNRFGPMYDAEKLGGGVTLAAMRVPDDRFDFVTETVNGFPEVAHNYTREHAFNMWFVISTEKPERIAEVISEIEAATGLDVYDMPKEQEFFIGLRLEV